MTSVADALAAIESLTDDAVLMQPVLGDASPPVTSGRLAGEAIVVKDCIAVPGAPTTAACPVLVDHELEPGGAVTRVLAAGATVVARASMHELAFGVTGRNDWRGMAINPASPDRVPGGSSSGSAVAVASGIVDVALGTDTGGSCRIPASCCGVFGFRPSTGRYPADGLVTLSETRDTVGILARRLDDVIRYDAVLAGTVADATEEEQPGRVAVLDAAGRGLCRPAVLNAYDGWLARCSARGVELVEVDLAPLLEANEQASFPIALRETVLSFSAIAAARGIDYDRFVAGVASPDVRDLLRLPMPTEAERRHAIERVIPDMRRWYEETLGRDGVADVLVIPTMPILPPLRDETEEIDLDGTLVATFPTMAAFTSAASLAGAPSLSVPVSGGEAPIDVPMGLMLEGRRGADAALLARARLLTELAT